MHAHAQALACPECIDRKYTHAGIVLSRIPLAQHGRQHGLVTALVKASDVEGMVSGWEVFERPARPLLPCCAPWLLSAYKRIALRKLPSADCGVRLLAEEILAARAIAGPRFRFGAAVPSFAHVCCWQSTARREAAGTRPFLCGGQRQATCPLGILCARTEPTSASSLCPLCGRQAQNLNSDEDARDHPRFQLRTSLSFSRRSS